jgi:hypothetical protein
MFYELRTQTMDLESQNVYEPKTLLQTLILVLIMGVGANADQIASSTPMVP